MKYEEVHTGDGTSYKIYKDEESSEEESNKVFIYSFTPKNVMGITCGIVYAKTKELAEQKLWKHYQEHIQAQLIQDDDDVTEIGYYDE